MKTRSTNATGAAAHCNIMCQWNGSKRPKERGQQRSVQIQFSARPTHDTLLTRAYLVFTSHSSSRLQTPYFIDCPKMHFLFRSVLERIIQGHLLFVNLWLPRRDDV